MKLVRYSHFAQKALEEKKHKTHEMIKSFK
jgi:hypothetical protein